MATINPYLNFDGQAEAAFEFYRSVFGGEFLTFQRFSDVPEDMHLPPDMGNRIMHVSLPISGNNVLMASDIHPTEHTLTVGNNFYISLNTESREETEYLFNALSLHGHIEMPLQDMFWGAYFGIFTDQFGIQWMVNCPHS